VAAKRCPPVAAIQADHIVLVYGTSHGHSGSTNLLWVIWLSKLTERPVYRRDEIRKPTGLDLMMPHITPDYFRREMWIDCFSIHNVLPRNVFREALLRQTAIS
jgi:hypothetical protein